ncbi:MAG: hypothetical protein ABUS56_11075 [Acidobacteriota bacterium]
MSMLSCARVSLLLAAVLLPSLGLAQPPGAPDNRGNHPEWTGLYRTARGAELAGFKPDPVNLDAEIFRHLQPWARLKLAQTNGVAEDTGAICQLDGIFRINLVGNGFMWLPTRDKVIIISTHFYSAGSRNVFVDRPHPKYPPPTWLGHSVGRWEGDTLVVDTVGFNSKSWLTSSMQPHTEELHVVERYRMAAKELMELQITVEDRQALSSPYTYTRYFKRVGDEVPENVCNADEGEQELWSGFRQKALQRGMVPAPAAMPTE